MAVASWAVLGGAFEGVQENAFALAGTAGKRGGTTDPPLRNSLTKARGDAGCGQTQRASAAAVSVPLALPRKGHQSNLQTRNWIWRETPDGLPCPTETYQLRILGVTSDQLRQRGGANSLNARIDRKLELGQLARHEKHAARRSSSNRVETPILAGVLRHRRSLPGECGSACDANCAQSNALDPLRPE